MALLVLGCLTLAAVGCGSSQHTSSAQLDAYLIDARTASQTASTLPRDQLLDLGRGVCVEYGKGKHLDDILKMQGATQLPTDLWSAVLVAATSDLCPQYKKRAQQDVGL